MYREKTEAHKGTEAGTRGCMTRASRLPSVGPCLHLTLRGWEMKTPSRALSSQAATYCPTFSSQCPA